MTYRDNRAFAVLIALLSLIILSIFVESVRSQSGSINADDGTRHLELGRLYEQAQEWDKAIAEYQMAATEAETVQNYQKAVEGLQRVLSLKSNLWLNLFQDINRFVYWLVLGILKIGIVGLISLLFIALLLKYFEMRAPLVIFPFTDLSSQSKETGSVVAETIVNTLHQARLIHAKNRTSSTLSTSEEVDLPSFSSQHLEESLVISLAALNSLNVGAIGLPVGSILESLFLWLTAGRRRIVGNLQRDGNRLVLTARLEEGRSHRWKNMWQVNQEFALESVSQQLIAKARSLAFEILFDLGKGWGTRSAKSLEQLTLGLFEFYKQDQDAGISSRDALERAVTYFETAIDFDPICSIAKYNLALTKIALGNYDQAIALLKSLRSHLHFEWEAERSYNLGVAYYHLAKDWAYEFAEKEFKTVVDALDPLLRRPLLSKRKKERFSKQLALAYCGLASICAQRVARDESKADLCFSQCEHYAQRALKTFAAGEIKAIIHTALGVAYLNLRDYSRATYELNRAIDLKPDYWRAYIYLGQVEIASGKLNGAISLLEQAIALNPYFEYAHYQLGQALRKRGSQAQNDLEKATEAYGKAKRIPAAHNELGRIYAQRNEFGKALEEFNKALQINSRYSNALVDLAWYTMEAGYLDPENLAKILEFAKRALDLERGKPSEWHKRAVLGRVYLEMGHFEKAEKELRTSIELQPQQPQSYYFLAKTLKQQNRYKEAREMLLRFFKLPKQEPWKKPTSNLMREIKSLLEADKSQNQS